MAKRLLIDEVHLLEKLREGDERAFRAIYNHYYDFLLMYAFQLSQDEDVAQDIVQDIFLNLWIKRASLDIHSSLFNYLHQSVRFGFFKQERKKGTDTAYKEDLRQYIHNYAHAGDEFLFEKELIARLEKLADDLPGKEGQIFTLTYFSQLTPEEIAEKLGVSQKTVTNLLARAVKNLKLQLGLGIILSYFIQF
ncbi:RNA polymerase sigma-70 factor, ECF subfamily [bacterium A37T11]|nr:RNA polymerase sigma-70 factor, ECF subfamily [bacterium A37T11]